MTETVPREPTRFDAADWTARLRALNPWLEANGLALPTPETWDARFGHAGGDALVAARADACRSRRLAGKDAWNGWAEAMTALKSELAAAGLWRARPIKLVVDERHVYLEKSDQPETAAFIALAVADFARERFSEDGSFREYRFPGAAWFRSADFDEATFGGAVFTGDADFRGARFSASAQFSGARFEGPARFSGATFKGAALFANARIRDSASFGGATFRGQARFGGVAFEGLTTFSSATFRETAQFGSATFKHRAIFAGAMFRGDAEFRSATFRRRAVFDASVFRAPADFANATFRSVGDFSGAVFRSEAAFERSVFRDTAHFQDAEIRRRVSFEDAEFRAWAGFLRATFVDRTVMRRAQFRGDAGFGSAAFRGRTDFRGAVFRARMDCAQAQFFGVTTFGDAAFHGYTSFEAVQGKEGSTFALARARFSGVPNFNQAHFQEAPRLDNVRVDTERAASFWGVNKDRDLSARWRSLKRLAVQGHDHQRELDFFAGEIKSERYVDHFPLPGRWKRGWKRPWRPLWPGGARYWLGLFFELFSNFGRSMFRPIVWWLLFVLVFAGVNLNQHFIERTELGLDGPTSVVDWATGGFEAQGCVAGRGEAASEALYLSAARGLVFTGLVGGARTPQTYACLFGVERAERTAVVLGDQFTPVVPPQISLFTTLQLLLSVALITLFLLAVRNHFRIR